MSTVWLDRVCVEPTDDPQPDSKRRRWSTAIVLACVLFGPLAHVLLVGLIAVALRVDGE